MQKKGLFDSIGRLGQAIGVFFALLIPMGFFLKFIEDIPWWGYVLLMIVPLFFLRKHIFSDGIKPRSVAQGAAGLLIQSVIYPLFRLLIAMTGLALTFSLINFLSRESGAYISPTLTKLIAAFSVGVVLTLAIIIVQGIEKAEKALFFIKGVQGFAWLIFFISLFMAVYHYVNPRFFNPYEEELVAEHNIDPVTCGLWDIDLKRNPDTGDRLRPMTPEDRPCVLEKERKDREAVLNAIEPIIIGFSENASARENQPNAYRRQEQKNYSIKMVSPPTTYQSVVRSGDLIHIEWKTDAPGYMQIHWTDGGENWMYVGKVVTSVGYYDWHPKIPGGTHIIVRIGVYNASSGKWLAEDSANMYVQSVVYMP